MRLQEWQANENLASYARTLLQDDRFQALLRVLEDEHPRNNRPVPTSELSARYAEMLGEIYGFDQCVNVIIASAEFIPPRGAVQAAFEDSPIEPAEGQ